MSESGAPRVLSERQVRWMLNGFPPLLFQRIRVTSIEPGFRACTVRVAKSRLTRNLQGTTFGGTIFASADPYHAILYWQVLARRGYRVHAWLRRASIEYRKPAVTALTLGFRLTDEDVSAAVSALEAEGRFARRHVTEAIDQSGDVCATVDTEVFLRRIGPSQTTTSEF